MSQIKSPNSKFFKIKLWLEINEKPYLHTKSDSYVGVEKTRAISFELVVKVERNRMIPVPLVDRLNYLYRSILVMSWVSGIRVTTFRWFSFQFNVLS